MDVLEAIKTRRSHKVFDPAHQMSPAELDELLECALMSPTAFNQQNWRFVIVQDPELRREIRKVSWNQAQVTDASLLVILTADLRAFSKDPKRYWAHTSQEIQDVMSEAMQSFYEGWPEVQRDEAMRSCGIAAQTLMLAAKGLGYESCPMDGFDFDAVGQLINLPKDHVISMFVAIGKPSASPKPRGGKICKTDLVIDDRFPR